MIVIGSDEFQEPNSKDELVQLMLTVVFPTLKFGKHEKGMSSLSWKIISIFLGATEEVRE